MATSKLSSSELDKFYSPYLSDEDSDYSDSDKSSGSEGSEGSEDSEGSESTNNGSSTNSSAQTFTKLAPVTISASEIRQNIFNKNGTEISEVSKSPEPPKTEITNSPLLFNQTTTSFTSNKVSTTIMINSTDRDANIFPYASAFNIRLPRTYRNVTGINAVQVKMVSSFYAFSNEKNNTTIPVQESGRVKNGTEIMNIISAVIRNGSYDSSSLALEIANQLNRAPIYSPISKNDFFQKFSNTGNYGLLFNDVGDTTYNVLTNTFDSLTSKNDLISRYFSSVIKLGTYFYTTDEMLVAYYFPLLHDFTIELYSPKNTVTYYFQKCIENPMTPKFNYETFDYKVNDASGSQMLINTNYYEKIVCGFTGLNDQYIYMLVSDVKNQSILDAYKQNNSWENCLLNNYDINYNNKTGLLTIKTESLNTSLVTTFNKQYDSIKSIELWKSQINPSRIGEIQKNINNTNFAITDMYNFLQTALTKIFSVKFGKYDQKFYTKLSNKILVRDGRGRYGWQTVYSGTQPQSSSDNNNIDSNGIFLNLAITSENADISGSDLFYPSVGGVASQYTFSQNVLTDLSGYIKLDGSSEFSYGFVDISFNILPTTYARILLRSKYRQTLYLSVLPSYNQNNAEKYPLINSTNTPLLYDIFGKLLLDPNDSIYTFYDISQNMLDGADYMRAQLTPNGQVYLNFAKQVKPVIVDNLVAGAFKITEDNPNLYFQINNGGYQIPQELYNQTTKFRSDIYIETETLGAPIGTNLDIYWYKDRGLYMSDLAAILNGVGTNNPKYYFIRTTVNADSSGCIITTDFISFDQSYLMIRTNGSVSVSLRVFVLRNDPYGDYENATSFDLVKYPHNLIQKPPIQTLFPNLYTSVDLTCGYDSNNISQNILDYCILLKNSINLDPKTMKENTQLGSEPIDTLCKVISPSLVAPDFSETWSPFFYSGSQNQIFYKLNGSIYNNAGANVKEYIFTNWFKAGAEINLYNSTLNPIQYPETTIIPVSSDLPFSTVDELSPFVLCFNSDIAYKTDISFNSFFVGIDSSETTIIDIMGIPFTPPPSRFCLPNSVTIKFAYVQPLSSDNTIVGRNTVLEKIDALNYKMANYSTNPSLSGYTDWDDHYFKNRRNLILGVFRSKDVVGKNRQTISLSNALCTLRLKKISQICTYETFTNGKTYPKLRYPEWGTYYVYERCSNTDNIWCPYNPVNGAAMSVEWTKVPMSPDISGQIYTRNYSGLDLVSYYNDVEANSLCFIPFFLDNPTATSATWEVGGFDALTYTELPYIPFISNPVNTENANVYYDGNKMVCIQDLSGYGLSAGSESLYLGPCGRLCWGVSSEGNIICPNYRNGTFKPTFFNIKLNLEISDQKYNPLYDYSSFQTDISDCYIHSNMFVYNLTQNPNSDIDDIKNAWGDERTINFVESDRNSGANYLPYINGLHVSTNDEMSVLIRGTLPTQGFEGILRIVGKNRIDFGLVTLQNIIDELDLLLENDVEINSDGSISNLDFILNNGFTEDYVRCLLLFNSQFLGTYNFGLDITNPSNASYGGIKYDLSGFKYFIGEYIKLYNETASASKFLSDADNRALSSIKQYINENYSGIIPSIYISRNKFTDPIPFSLKFKSTLSPLLADAFDKWGLGWNIGFDKIDTVYNTLQTASTFLRIIEYDFIYLKLNKEFKINGLDLSSKENLLVTREPVGIEGNYFGKLLLSPFGTYAQTFVQTTKPFPHPISKIDKLDFSFYDANNKQIFNKDCEFNIVIDISEVVDAIDPSSLIIRGTGGLKAPGY